MMGAMKMLTLKEPTARLGWPQVEPTAPATGSTGSSRAGGTHVGDTIVSKHDATRVGWPATEQAPAPDVSRETLAATPVVSRETASDASTDAPAETLTSSAIDEPVAVGTEMAIETDTAVETTNTTVATTEAAVEIVATVQELEPATTAAASPGSAVTRQPTVSRETSRAASLPRPRETRVLTVANQKGGVGKTTTAVNVAAALSQAGLRVLVVDMDPQGNASTALGIPHDGDAVGVYDVLIDGLPLADVVQQSPSLPGLWCAPATIDLAGAEIELVPMVARESRLRKAIAAFLKVSEEQGEPFDYVFIDCPPSLGLLTINSFVAGSEVLIPIQCEYYALEGLSQLLNNIDLIREHLNPDLQVSHILLTMFDGRTRLSAQVAEEVRAHFTTKVLRTSIPRSVRISEAPSHGETVITYDPISSGALCYLEAAKEVARAAQAQEEDGEDD